MTTRGRITTDLKDETDTGGPDMGRTQDTEANLKRLRRRCESRLGELQLPSPFDVHRFCEELASRRGRPIQLCPVPMGEGPSGFWMAGPRVDFIFFEEQTSPLHQAQITLHEACHIVCGHRPIELSETEVSRLIFPDLREEIVQSGLQRGGYSTSEEREAEFLASLILEHVAPGPGHSATLDQETANMLERHRVALEDMETRM